MTDWVFKICLYWSVHVFLPVYCFNHVKITPCHRALCRLDAAAPLCCCGGLADSLQQQHYCGLGLTDMKIDQSYYGILWCTGERTNYGVQSNSHAFGSPDIERKQQLSWNTADGNFTTASFLWSLKKIVANSSPLNEYVYRKLLCLHW